MSMYLPEELRWLGWIAGSTWPDGDEDQMWAIAEAWKAASEQLQAQLAHIDTAKQSTSRAYPQGHAAEEMGKLFDGLRSGDQSLDSLAKYMQQISDSTFDMGTQLQATKLTIVISLAWLAMEILWAWMFPPTAPVVEAAAITTTRSFLRVFEDMVQKVIQNLARKLGASAEKRYFWKTVASGRFVLPTAKGWGVYGVKFAETAVTSGGLNAAVQLGQMADGKRRHFDAKEFGVSVFASVASALPSREFARYLGNGIDKLAGRQLNNVWGRTGRGAFIGAGAGVVGSAAGNIAVGVATGDWSSFSTPQGWVGGAARGAMVGGARGAFAKSSPISRSDVRYPLWMHKPGAPRTPPSNAASRGSSVHDGSTRSPGSSIRLESLNGDGSRVGSGSGRSVGSGGQSVHSGSHRTGPAPSVRTNGGGSSHGTGPAPSERTSGGGSSHGTGPAPSVQTNGSSHRTGPAPSVHTNGGGSSHGTGPAPSVHTSGGSSHATGPAPSVHTSGSGSSNGPASSVHTGGGSSHGTGPASSVHTGGGSSHGTGPASSVHTSDGGSSYRTGPESSVHTSGGGSQNSAPVVTNGSGSHQGSPSVNSGGSTGSGRGDTGSRGTLDSDGRSFHTGRGTVDSQGQSFHTARESYRTAQESLGSGQSSVRESSGQPSVHESSGGEGSTRSGRNGFVPPTSWQASVDGGWQPPAGRGGSVDGGTPPVSPINSSSSGGEARSVSPIPGSSTHTGSGGDRPSTASGASGHGSSVSHPPSSAPPTGTGSTRNTNPPVPQPHHPAGQPDPFLGASKDMKAKTRPKRLPYWAPLPGVFNSPHAPDASAWVYGDSAADGPREGTGEGVDEGTDPDSEDGVDVPFTLKR
ncbi:hypothetical protein [Nocardia sp. NPDC050175]|uniref:WXG100-like domain-containing protein n=1 Tax=Nocardia sp. NPDC050175 TaxID=3364317 RepID=UPI0037B08A53